MARSRGTCESGGDGEREGGVFQLLILQVSTPVTIHERLPPQQQEVLVVTGVDGCIFQRWKTRPPRTRSFLLADREARMPRPPADPLVARLEHAILSLGALAARPQFHGEARSRAGLGGYYFPQHPARRVDPAAYGVLAALADEGMPGPSSIAVRLGFDPSTVSDHLRPLQERGLVERRPYFGHSRWRDVELTPAGRDAYETLRDARHEALAALIVDWPADEKAQLTAVVGRLGDAVRVHNLAVHERCPTEARHAARRRTPEEIEKARRYQRARCEREHPEAVARSPRRRPTVRVPDLFDFPGT